MTPMPHPADVPALLAERLIRLDYRLVVNAPKGAITAELREAPPT